MSAAGPMAAPSPQVNVPSNFNGMTRRKIIPMGTLTKPVAGGQSTFQALPKTGYLARLYLAIRGTVAGTVTGPNALGMASIVRRVRVYLNSGLDVFNVSGAGYHYLLRQSFDQPSIDPVAQSNARSAVTATTFNLDMVVPIAMNMRDPLGLLLLQSESTLVTVQVDWESDVVVATGGPTVTGTCVIWGEIFTVPPSATDQPPTNVVHQILEETIAIAGAGDVTYVWPRGGVYLQLYHGYGMAQAGVDSFNRYKVRAAQSDFIQDTDLTYLDMGKMFQTGLARLAGTIPMDLYASAGLGMYDLMRDTIDTSRLTDIASVITATGAGTLYSLRRQLLVLQ